MGNWKSKEKKDKAASKKANIKQLKEGYPKFHEYLASSGKTVEKAPVEKVADYKGPKASRPPKSGAWLEDADRKGKKKGVGTPAPYSAPGSDPGQKKGERGFGDQGAKELVYCPGTDTGAKGQKQGTWPKHTKIESFLSATKDMSTEEYVKAMRDRTINGGLEYEAIRYIATNPITLTALVREVRRQGNLETLLETLLEIPDAHKILVEALAENPRFQKALSRAMDDNVLEMIGPPMHKDEDEEDEDEESEPTPEGGAHDSLDDMEPEDDEDEDDDDEEDHEDDDDEEGHEEDGPPDMDDLDDDEPSGDMESEPHHRSPIPPHLRDKIRKMMRGI